MFKAISSVFGGILKIFIPILYLFVFIIIIFIICLLGWFFWLHFIKRMPIPKRKVKRPIPHYSKQEPWIKMIFWSFPKRIILDRLTLNPDRFDTYGVHIFCGEQGSGKSIACVHFIKSIKERNPMCKISANIDLDCMDSSIEDISDIIGTNNGELGQVVFLDELQNWFSSNESKNFPPEMLTEITQQRKQAKCIVGTSQVFTRLSKPIREQITLLYKPTTIAGAFTIVRVYRCHVNQEGALENQKMLRMYGFVHDDELRNAYDTYNKVERLVNKGFVIRTDLRSE